MSGGGGGGGGQLLDTAPIARAEKRSSRKPVMKRPTTAEAPSAPTTRATASAPRPFSCSIGGRWYCTPMTPPPTMKPAAASCQKWRLRTTARQSGPGRAPAGVRAAARASLTASKSLRPNTKIRNGARIARLIAATATNASRQPKASMIRLPVSGARIVSRLPAALPTLTVSRPLRPLTAVTPEVARTLTVLFPRPLLTHVRAACVPLTWNRVVPLPPLTVRPSSNSP